MALSRAEHRVVLTDSTKFGQTALVNVCDFAGIDRLVTERLPEGQLADQLSHANVKLDLA